MKTTEHFKTLYSIAKEQGLGAALNHDLEAFLDSMFPSRLCERGDHDWLRSVERKGKKYCYHCTTYKRFTPKELRSLPLPPINPFEYM